MPHKTHTQFLVDIHVSAKLINKLILIRCSHPLYQPEIMLSNVVVRVLCRNTRNTKHHYDHRYLFARSAWSHNVATMVFHVQCIIYFLENLLEFFQLLSRYYQKQTTPQNTVCFSAIKSSMIRVKALVSWSLIYIYNIYNIYSYLMKYNC